MRVCRTCGELKPDEEFAKRGQGYRRLDCRSCMNELARDRYWDTPEEERERSRQRTRTWYEVNRDRVVADRRIKRTVNAEAHRLADKRERMIRVYGMTPEEYEAILERQGGGCALCRTPPPDGRRLDIDHDHATGRVRGLLCRRCNMALGLMDDDAKRLARAGEYLSVNEPRLVVGDTPVMVMIEERNG